PAAATTCGSVVEPKPGHVPGRPRVAAGGLTRQAETSHTTEAPMIPKIRVTTVQPHGSCHECGQIDHSSPHILVQRRNDGRSGGPVDGEAQYCGRCEPTIMER